MLPAKLHKNSGKADKGRRSPAHRAWVRSHACSACGSETNVECAHVRDGTHGGTGIKPADWWCISLCGDCHRQQHSIGERKFEALHDFDMKILAQEFFKQSPHRSKLTAWHA